MEFDNGIRRKIRMDLPKLLLYDGVEYEKLLNAYHATEYQPIQSYLHTLSINLTYEDMDELIVRRNMNIKMISFFLNYLQNENLMRGEELSKKLYFAILQINLYDADGNLEYDMLPDNQQNLTFPNYVDSVFKEIILTCKDLDRWYALYINKETRVGQFLDFKNDGKVEVYQNLEVLNEIIQEEFGFEILDYDIRVLSDSVNMDTDGAFFFINLFYKLINGTPLTSLTFSGKEQDILLPRLIWILLKTKSLDQSKKQGAQNTKSSKNISRFQDDLDEVESEEEDDIVLDKSLHTKTNNNTRNSNKRQKTINTLHDDDNEEDYDSVSDVMATQTRSNKNQKNPSIHSRKRNQTKMLSVASKQNSSRNIDLQESFDFRNDSDFNQNVSNRNYVNQSNEQVSYQESTDEDLDSMWKFGKSSTQPKKKVTQIKKIDDVEDQLNKLWDFKTNYKRGMKGQFNQPALIPEELKPYYKERNNQTSIQRDIQDKVIDVLAFLESANGKQMAETPSLAYAVNRLKDKLGVSSQGDSTEGSNESEKIKMKNISEMKQLLKQKMMQEATGDLDHMLQRQQILDDILEQGSQERDVLEKRFENEIKKIDTKFQDYIQKYESLNTFQNMQSQFGQNPPFGPHVDEIIQMKESMHTQLHNYLLGGLGLPTKYSNNPNFTAKPQSPAELAPIPGFNRSSVLQNNNSNNTMQQGMGKNRSMINLNRNSMIQSPASLKSDGSNSLSPQVMLSPIDNKSYIVASRYNVSISEKQLIDFLTNDIISDSLVKFILRYLEERYFQTTKRDIMIREEKRILLFPIEFYAILAGNSPMVKQSQLNIQGVERFTQKYIGKNTIFNEFDKLIFPVLLEKPQHYTLVVADLNVHQLIYFPIYSFSNLRKEERPNKQVSYNILKFLEREYSQKIMKSFKLLEWVINDIPCAQTTEPQLSAYYLFSFVSMIYDSNFKFKNVDAIQLKQIKLWIPEVLNSVGKTSNKPAELQVFIPPP